MKTMSNTVKCLLLLHLIIIVNHELKAQKDIVENAMRSDGVLQPEASKFSYKSVGSVDFHGDYNASIPLMTLPGRGGLDFPISISYKAGIKTLDKATWVGLGWNLDVGSIGRIVNFLPDCDSTRNRGIMKGNVRFGRQLPENSDVYIASIPGLGSSVIIPIESAVDSFSATRPVFKLQEWKSWKVINEYDNCISKRKLSQLGGHCSGSSYAVAYDQYGGYFTQNFYKISGMSQNCLDTTYLFRRNYGDPEPSVHWPSKI